jgi:UDP-N-acetylglucosamine:LPS N-acetylglucosamine transferase
MTMRGVRVLAACSGGGHWEQMMLLRPMLDRFDTVYATTIPELGSREGIELVAVLPDANRDTPAAMMRGWQAARRLVQDVRPDVIVSTGALPGLMCLAAGRLSNARTLWLDSVANSERLSVSGKLASRFATRCMVQWEHLARPPAILFDGSLL